MNCPKEHLTQIWDLNNLYAVYHYISICFLFVSISFVSSTIFLNRFVLILGLLYLPIYLLFISIFIFSYTDTRCIINTFLW